MKSWKTTVTGVLTILGAACVAGKALLDADPLTVPDWAAVGTAVLAGIGLIMARDNDVSSEAAGAK